ncbi:MAG: class B sortase [Clostridia bacterium]|nr:class B sortase [Clostridia bacterium]
MKNTDTGQKQKKGRFIFWIVLFTVCTLVAAVCLGFWVYHLVLRGSMNKLYNDAREVVSVSSNNGSSAALQPLPNDLSDEDSKKEWNMSVVKIDFDLLRETSKDVYAWIEIPGSKIQYPIVQHPTNNSYYLRKAINGAYDITGCIYTQNYNSTDFSDPNTVIYGHYMDDGTKFGSLLSYMDKEYFESHRDIVIYTPTEMFHYRVFAALPFDTRHIIRNYARLENPTSAFLADVYNSSDARTIIADDITVDGENNRIITLSTCLKTGTRRYLVLAVLVNHNYKNK